MNTTALELGHTSTKMLFTNYREAVKPDAARQWWALTPARVKRKPGAAAGTGKSKGRK